MLVVRTTLGFFGAVFTRACALFVFSCIGAAAGAAYAEAPIRIGASLSLTGSYAALGQNQLRGYQLCVKHANEKGGVLGRKLELVTEDDQSQAPVAVEVYEKLITRDKVDAILGPYSSPITEAVANVSEKHRMPMVAAGAASASIFKKGRKFVFMNYSSAEVYLEGLLDISAKRGLKTIAVLNEDSLFPRRALRGLWNWRKRKDSKSFLQNPILKVPPTSPHCCARWPPRSLMWWRLRPTSTTQ